MMRSLKADGFVPRRKAEAMERGEAPKIISYCQLRDHPERYSVHSEYIVVLHDYSSQYCAHHGWFDRGAGEGEGDI